MILWFILGALAVLAAGLVLTPLLRARKTAATRAEYDIEVYLDQLNELERDIARGLVDAQDAAGARTEIEHHLLAAERARQADAHPVAPQRRRSPVRAIALAIVIPMVALALYSRLGSPGLPGLPFAERPVAAPTELAARAETRIAEAEAVVRAEPQNARAWYELGRMRFAAQQWQGASEDAAEALRLAPERGDYASALGESLVYAADGDITPQARAAFEQALTLSPGEPRSRFYLAVALVQAGRETEALDAFAALLRDAPADAPWRPQVETQARALAANLGADADALFGVEQPPAGTRAPRGPDAGAVAAARDMAPEERSAMIRGMVENLAARLESEPDDVAGWRQLARSWGVLGDHGKASEAYGRALALAPDDPETLFRGALAAADADDTGTALDRFKRLRPLIPPDTDAYEAVSRAIERFEANNTDK